MLTDITKKHWSIKTALEQVIACGFESEAGPLSNNVAWQWLEAAAKVGPEFWPGQGVWYEVTGEVNGVKLGKWAHFFVVGCQMASDNERRYWTYSLSNDPPGPWHYGKTAFTAVSGAMLKLDNPDA